MKHGAYPGTQRGVAALAGCIAGGVKTRFTRSLVAGVSADMLAAPANAGALSQLFYDQLCQGADPAALVQNTMQFQRALFIYRKGMQYTIDRIQALAAACASVSDHNPAQRVTGRVKAPESIAEKLRRKGRGISLDAMQRHIHDVAGVRVICPYLNDVYALARLIAAQSDMTLLWQKDYVALPKASGYRGLHLGVEVRMSTAEGVLPVEVEIQLRTAGMDAWAALEHRVGYKPIHRKPASASICCELRRCATMIAQAESRLQTIASSTAAITDSGAMVLFDERIR